MTYTGTTTSVQIESGCNNNEDVFYTTQRSKTDVSS